VWVKSNAGQGSFYRSQHEFVVVFRAGEAAHEQRRTRAPRSFAFECLELPRRKHIRRRTYGGAGITSDCQARRACCRCDARLYGASRHLPGYIFGLRATITRSEAVRRAPATPFRCGPPRYGCRPGEKAQPITAIASKCRERLRKCGEAQIVQAKSGHFSITCIASAYSRSRETVIALAGTFRGETGASSAILSDGILPHKLLKKGLDRSEGRAIKR
jgi:hypothetical protein